jgi:hypothetical protein
VPTRGCNGPASAGRSNARGGEPEATAGPEAEGNCGCSAGWLAGEEREGVMGQERPGHATGATSCNKARDVADSADRRPGPPAST